MAMKLLYQYSITGELQIPDRYGLDIMDAEEPDKEDSKYIREIVDGFIEKRDDIDSVISLNSHSWKIERISKVDLAILRLALFEMKYLDIPSKVAVNEAVEIAKKYSADKSYKYINGLLGGYLKSIE